jgi:hypothetical protein
MICPGVQPAGARETFDRRHRLGDSRRERQARQYASSADMHRTRAALTVIAAFLRAGEIECLAQGVEEAGPSVESHSTRRSVDVEPDREEIPADRSAATGSARAPPSFKAGTATAAAEAPRKARPMS